MMQARILQATLLSAAAVAMFAATAGAASATTPVEFDRQVVPVHSAKVMSAASGGCSLSNYSRGLYSVDELIINNTGQDLTLDGPDTWSAGHWAARPAQTLPAGDCEDINSYTNDPMSDAAMNAMYSTPNGDYLPFTASEDTDTPNSQVFTGKPTYAPNMSATTWGGTVNTSYTIANDPSQSGTLHVHASLTAEPQTN